MGKPDLYARQVIDGMGVYFECRQPKDDTHQSLKEQRKIFDGIEDIISNKYSLAIFYDKKLSDNKIEKLRYMVEDSFKKREDIFENRIIVDSQDIGVKLVISGISDNIEKDKLIEIEGLPNFSDEKGYSNANGINRYGKNIVFYKAVSKNALGNQLKNSLKKVPEGRPYVVCIDLSGPRFDTSKSTAKILNHFKRGDFSSFSGVLLVNHGVIKDGKYHVQLHYIENEKSKSPIPFLRGFFRSPLSVDIELRLKCKKERKESLPHEFKN